MIKLFANKNIIKCTHKIYRFTNVFLISCAITIICAYIFLNALSFCFQTEKGDVELFSPISKDWYIYTFFNNRNIKDSQYAQPQDNNIVIIDIEQEASSRRGFAEIFKALGKVGARCVAVDMFLEEDNDSYNDSLTQVINNLNSKTNLVVAAVYDDNKQSVTQSFFNKGEGIKYGVTNKPNLLTIDSLYNNYPTFAARIAQSIGCYKEFNCSYIINFRVKKIPVVSVKSGKEITEIAPSLKDKILIIGSTSFLNDGKNLPFAFERGVDQTAGCKVMAYELSSWINMGTNDKYRAPLKMGGSCNNLLFCIISLFVYIVIFISLKKICMQISSPITQMTLKRFSGTKVACLKMILKILFNIILLLFVQWIVIRCCFLVTEDLLVIPNIYLFIISLMFFPEIHKEINQFRPKM